MNREREIAEAEMALDDHGYPLIGIGNPVEWACHVCGAIRRDKDISVHTIRRTEHGVEATENIRYCNDRSECRSNAHLGHRALAIRRSSQGSPTLKPVEYVPYLDRRPSVGRGLLFVIALILAVELVIGVAIIKAVMG